MDNRCSKSELSERWRVWLRGLTYRAEGKANLYNAIRRHFTLYVMNLQNVADSLSRVMKVPPSPCDGSTKEYIGMITVDITPGAMITRQIERASAEDKEQQKCIAVGRQETGVLLLIRTDCCVMKVL